MILLGSSTAPSGDGKGFFHMPSNILTKRNGSKSSLDYLCCYQRKSQEIKWILSLILYYIILGIV